MPVAFSEGEVIGLGFSKGDAVGVGDRLELEDDCEGKAGVNGGSEEVGEGEGMVVGVKVVTDEGPKA